MSDTGQNDHGDPNAAARKGASRGASALTSLPFWATAILSALTAVFSLYANIQIQNVKGSYEQSSAFQDRVFTVSKELQDAKGPLRKMYLIGLYGQARGDRESKVIVVGVAAALCDPDLFQIANGLIKSDPDHAKLQQDPILSAAVAFSRCPGASDPANPDGSPPPERVSSTGQQAKSKSPSPSPASIALADAQGQLLATLTPENVSGWIFVGHELVGNESGKCVVLGPDSYQIVDTVDEFGNRKLLDQCAVNNQMINALPRDINAAATPIKLRLKTDSLVYDTANPRINPGRVLGALRKDSTVIVDGHTVGTDVYNKEGKKTFYAVWVHVRGDQTKTNGSMPPPQPASTTSAPLILQPQHAPAPTPASRRAVPPTP